MPERRNESSAARRRRGLGECSLCLRRESHTLFTHFLQLGWDLLRRRTWEPPLTDEDYRRAASDMPEKLAARDWTTEPYTKDELLVENVQMVRRLTLGDIEDGADPVEALNKALDFIVGFIESRHGMIVPPHMVPPAELEEAVAWGRKLAEEHGW